MKKTWILGIVLLLSISFVSALNLVTGDEATLFGNCILPNGSLGGDNMTFTAYYPNTTIFINNQLMDEFASGQFNYTFTVPNITGIYPYSMTCYFSGDTASASDEFIVLEVNAQDFVSVSNTVNTHIPIAVAIFLPLILSIIFLVGAVSFNKEEHNAMKIALYLLSVPPFFTSMHFATVAIDKYFEIPELVNAMAQTIEWVGYIYGVIIAYFAIYLLVSVIKTIQKKKAEKLKY